MKVLAVFVAILVVSSAFPGKQDEAAANVADLLKSLLGVLNADEISAKVMELLNAGEPRDICVIFNWVTEEGSLFRGFINEVRANEDYQKLLKALKEEQVNVDLATETLDYLLNMYKPPGCDGVGSDEEVLLPNIGAEIGNLYPTLEDLDKWYDIQKPGAGIADFKVILGENYSKATARLIACHPVIEMIVRVFEAQGYPNPGAAIAYLIQLLELDWQYPPDCSNPKQVTNEEIKALLESLVEVLRTKELVTAVKDNILEPNLDVDLCRVFVWASGKKQNDTAFVDLLRMVETNENTVMISDDLTAIGIKVEDIKEAFKDLIGAKNDCDVNDEEDAILENIGALLSPSYPTLADILSWLGMNEESMALDAVLSYLSGDSPVFRLVDILACDPTIDRIVNAFLCQGYRDPTAIIGAVSGALGWSPLTCPPQTECIEF